MDPEGRKRRLLIVGNTLAARCYEGEAIDPVHSEPYPLRRIKLGDKELPLIPMVVERCPSGASCKELGEPVVLKPGSHEKACKGLPNCQEPWPRKWKDMERRFLVLDLKVKRKINVVPARIKAIRENKLILSGWRVLEFDELVWTAPYPYLASLLDLPSPKSLEATLAIFKAEADWELAYHLGDANPFYAMIRVWDYVWAIGPGSFDAYGAVKHLERKGYLKFKGNLVYYTINYYAMEDVEVRAPEGIKLFGRTAEWKEKSLEELLECGAKPSPTASS